MVKMCIAQIGTKHAHGRAAFARLVAGEMENPYSYDHEPELYETNRKCCQEETR